MFTRVVEIKTKPGKAKELCSAIHERVLSMLKAQPGFIDEIVLISDTDAERVLALSFWKTKEDAERHSHEQYSKISDMIHHEAHASPKVHMYTVETSTAHKVAKGKAV
jgi:heme-degrading monooxygenase HmoA